MKQAGNIHSGCCLLDFYCALLSEITVICAFSGGSKPHALPFRKNQPLYNRIYK